MRPQAKGIGLAIVGAGRVGLFRGEVAARHGGKGGGGGLGGEGGGGEGGGGEGIGGGAEKTQGSGGLGGICVGGRRGGGGGVQGVKFSLPL